MRPKQILAFISSVLLLLFLISLFFPEEGIRINREHKLQFPGLRELFGTDTIQYADISAILAQSTVDEEYPGPMMDTLRANADSLKASVYPIEYPGNDPTLLYPFFRQLRRLKQSGQLIRIMHYGDSQIEGDRMSSYIRYRLQNRFGGSGIGLQPVVQLYGYQLSLKHTGSDNWRRYTAFGQVDSSLSHNNYGALASFARYTPYPVDSLERDTTVQEAWINLGKSLRAFPVSRQYSRCRLFYGNSTEPVFVEIYADGELFDADFLPRTKSLASRSWKFAESPDELSFHFKSACSPDFYGISLEGTKGVALDNIPLRGSSGLLFSKLGQQHLRQMYNNLNVKLILLQFGGNVVPYISGKSDSYERWFYRELSRLKALLPNTAIVVIGVADMSTKQKDRYATYPNLEHVRDALKNAAFKANCPFWDMYGAMGGKNSMPSWVFAEPPLASSDFVHFNERGARIVAEMFYNAFIYDYERYLEEN